MKLGKHGMFSLVFFISFVILQGCGPKVNRAELDAEAYFAFAKKLFDSGKYYEATNEFSIIVLKFSGNPIVDDAQFYLAKSHFGNHEYLIALAEYQKLVDNYPESPYVEEAYYNIGVSALKLSLRPELDQEYTKQALRHFQNFVEAYPRGKFRKEAEEQISKLRNKLAKKQLIGGNVYRKMGYHDSALIYYDMVLSRYYDTPSAEPATFYKAECLYKQKMYEKAISNFTAFIEKYPNSKLVKRAKKRIVEIQELINK